MVRARTATVNENFVRIPHPRSPIRFDGDRTAVPILQSIEGNVREAPMVTELQLGPRIRSLRQARRLTLREVSQRAGVTESFLSQVERDVTSPSIATVQRIARALDLSIAQLFAEEPEMGRVVRREARRRVAYPGLKAVDEFLTSNMAGRLQVIMSTIEPGGPWQLVAARWGIRWLNAWWSLRKGKAVAIKLGVAVQLGLGEVHQQALIAAAGAFALGLASFELVLHGFVKVLQQQLPGFEHGGVDFARQVQLQLLE